MEQLYTFMRVSYCNNERDSLLLLELYAFDLLPLVTEADQTSKVI